MNNKNHIILIDAGKASDKTLSIFNKNSQQSLEGMSLNIMKTIY